MNALTRPIPADRAKRVLHVNRVGYIGGVERVILTLAEGLRQEGFDAIIACPPGGDLIKSADKAGLETVATPIDRMRITLNPSVMLRYPLQLRAGTQFLRNYCRSNAIDLIHTHHPVGALYARRACSELGLPLILHVHEILPAKPLYALALKVALRHADHVMSCSTAGRELVARVGGSADRVEIVHNGVSDTFMLQAVVAESPDLGSGGPHIGMVGQIEPRKGQEVFLSAAEEVLKRYPKAVFWIIGGAPLSEKADYAERLHERARARPLRGHIRFTGHRDDVPALMKFMDVVALPSVAHESLPMALIEAMMLGRPVVASRIGGTPEIIRDGETGYLVTPGDAHELSDAILKLLHSNGAICSARALIDARERFSSRRFARQVGDIYQRLLQPETRIAQ